MVPFKGFKRGLPSLLFNSSRVLLAMDVVHQVKAITTEPSPSILRTEPSELRFKPIGYIESWFTTKNGTPRQASVCPKAKAVLRLEKSVFTNPGHALDGLSSYSHVWIMFHFHKNTNKSIKAKVRPPRLDGKTVGVLASRSPHRPNPIGLSLAKIEKVEGDCVHLSGVDILDGSPILDIKPYILEYDCPQKAEVPETCSGATINDVEQKETSDEAQVVMGDIEVDFTPKSLQELSRFHSRANHGLGKEGKECSFCLEYLSSWEEAREVIETILGADPRSVYRRNKCSDRLYYFTVDKRVHVTTWFDTDSKCAQVVKIKPIKAISE